MGRAFLAQLRAIFPDYEEAFLQEQMTPFLEHPQGLERACNAIMEHPDPPKRPPPPPTPHASALGEEDSTPAPRPAPRTLEGQVAQLANQRSWPGTRYMQLASQYLQAHFRYVPKPHLDKLLYAHSHLLSAYHALRTQQRAEMAAYRAHLESQLAAAPSPPTAQGLRHALTYQSPADFESARPLQGRPLHFRFLKGGRPSARVPPRDCGDARFHEDRALLEAILGEELQAGDAELARSLNQAEYEKENALIGCPCCYEDVPFDDMTSCDDGHLFCCACAARHAQAVMESGKVGAALPCFEPECSYPFPLSQIRKFLDAKTLQFFLKQQQRHELAQAQDQLDGHFVQCPYCEYGVLRADEGEGEGEGPRVFQCPSCQRASCVACREEAHVPRTCEEAAKAREAGNLLNQVTDRMSEALVRQCPKCRTRFFKEDGCNKMTCPCGQSMCYLCREPVKDYSHFKPQGSCPLHTDTRADNEKDVSTAKDQTLHSLSQSQDAQGVDLRAMLQQQLRSATPTSAAPPSATKAIQKANQDEMRRRILQQRQAIEQRRRLMQQQRRQAQEALRRRMTQMARARRATPTPTPTPRYPR